MALISKAFDPEHHCENCYTERKSLMRYLFLPNSTINGLQVRVCEYCDGSELVRLATREGA